MAGDERFFQLTNTQQVLGTALTPRYEEIQPVDFSPVTKFLKGIRASIIDYLNTPVCGGCESFKIDPDLTLISNMSRIDHGYVLEPFFIGNFEMVGRCQIDNSIRTSFVACNQKKK